MGSRDEQQRMLASIQQLVDSYEAAGGSADEAAAARSKLACVLSHHPSDNNDDETSGAEQSDSTEQADKEALQVMHRIEGQLDHVEQLVSSADESTLAFVREGLSEFAHSNDKSTDEEQKEAGGSHS
jgi:hypothetical protein